MENKKYFILYEKWKFRITSIFYISDSHKLIKNTVTPTSNPFNDKEGWKHDRNEIKARNRKIRHNKKNIIFKELSE